jgi:hypothetical protein
MISEIHAGERPGMLARVDLPTPLREAFARAEFWRTYYLEPREGGDPDDIHRLDFALGAGFAVRVTLDLTCTEVSLVTPSGDARLLGHADDHCSVGTIFRWAELEALCRAIALGDASLPHPGLPLLLLAPFAPLCVGDPAKHARASLHAAFARVGDVGPALADRCIEANDGRAALFRWVRDEQIGWTPDPERPYGLGMAMHSLRVPPPAEDDDVPVDEDAPVFPHDAFAEMMAHVGRRLADAGVADIEAELARLEQDTPGPDLAPPVRRRLSIDLAIERDDGPGSRLAFKLLENALLPALKDLDWGRLEGAGGHSDAHRMLSEWASLLLRGDVGRSVALVREWIAWLGIEDVSLRLTNPDEESLASPWEGRGRVVRLASFRSTYMAEGPHAWFHQDPLAPEQLAVVRRATASAEPGERARALAFDDGGRLLLYACRPDWQGDGLTVVLDDWSLAAARWLALTMRDARLTMLPQVIVTSADALPAALCPVPGTIAVDSVQHLYDLIAGGPAEFWRRRPPHLTGAWWERRREWYHLWR